jgi:hypothetical protein
LLEYARSLPQHARTQPVPVAKSYEQYPPGFGALLIRMLGNRNLNWWQSAATFARLTGGRLYLSAATVVAVGRDHNRLTPDLLVGFAVVLGIPVGDLAALGDVRLPDGGVPAYSEHRAGVPGGPPRARLGELTGDGWCRPYSN